MFLIRLLWHRYVVHPLGLNHPYCVNWRIEAGAAIVRLACPCGYFVEFRREGPLPAELIRELNEMESGRIPDRIRKLID